MTAMASGPVDQKSCQSKCLGTTDYDIPRYHIDEVPILLHKTTDLFLLHEQQKQKYLHFKMRASHSAEAMLMCVVVTRSLEKAAVLLNCPDVTEKADCQNKWRGRI